MEPGTNFGAEALPACRRKPVKLSMSEFCHAYQQLKTLEVSPQ